MAIVGTHKTAINTGVDVAPGVPIDSASITPTDNNTGYLVRIIAKRLSGTIVVPTLSGLGLTWTEELGSISTTRGLWLFKGQGTPSSGVLSITFASGTIDYIVVLIDEFQSVDQTDMTVQAVQASVGSGATSSLVTLAAFADAVNNAAYGGTNHSANEATTPEADYTELGDQNAAYADNIGLESEYKVGEDTSVTASWATSTGYRSMAVELKAVVGGFTAEIDTVIDEVQASINLAKQYLAEIDTVIDKPTALINVSTLQARIAAIIDRVQSSINLSQRYQQTIATQLDRVVALINLTVAHNVVEIDTILGRPQVAINLSHEQRLTLSPVLDRVQSSVNISQHQELTIVTSTDEVQVSINLATQMLLEVDTILDRVIALLNLSVQPNVTIGITIDEVVAAINIQLDTGARLPSSSVVVGIQSPPIGYSVANLPPPIGEVGQVIIRPGEAGGPLWL